MKIWNKIAGIAGMSVAAAFCGSPAAAQVPPVPAPVAVAPIIANTAAPIIIGAITPKSKTAGLGKFEGYVMSSNIAQITMRDRGNETSIQTFSLSKDMSARMQVIVDKGGFQYGDKVTVYYDPTTKQVLKIKGKPSKPI
jgi:hypothetical protein